MDRIRANQGFTLFEVLVSAAILSASCLVLVQALTASLHTQSRVQDLYAAGLALEDALWTVDHSLGEFTPDQAHPPADLQNTEWDFASGVLADAILQKYLTQNTLTLRWTSMATAARGHQEILALSAYIQPKDSPGSAN